jgi:hypothetical protein
VIPSLPVDEAGAVTNPSPDRSRGGRLPARLATVAFVAAVGGLALACQTAPSALPIDAPADTFSAARAMRHVAAIAREPHPLGSPAAEPVRAYVLAELKALGLEPAIQRPRDAPPAGSGSGSAATPTRRDVRNLVARWRGAGPPSRKALLLSAHYDSVPSGPGAGDDASGVAAILESLRALKAGPPPERDLIVLVNDGEEAGLYGADVFAAEHPWAQDVGVVLNLEGRGNRGPAYMFETSQGNAWLIEQLARALPHPMATSLTVAVYRLMPNDTDLTVYRRHGMPGLNFAFVGGLSYYHSPEDTPDNLDPRTLQHQGENLLAMARHLGRLDLDDVRRDDVVYSSVLGRFVLSYPMTWVVPLMACAVLGYVAVTMLGVWKGRVRIAELGAGLGLSLVAGFAAIAAVAVLWSLVALGLARMGVPALRYDLPLLTGFSAVAVAIAAAIFAGASRRWSWEGLGLGVLAWWLAATVATSRALPGGSYAFLWPLLPILAGQAVSFAAPRGGTIAILASWLGAVPLLLVYLAILPGLFDALNLRMALYLMIPVLFLAGALVPMAAQVLAPRAGA